MYTKAAITEMEGMIVDAGINPLMKRLSRHADAGEAIDIMPLFSYMTFVGGERSKAGGCTHRANI